MFDMWREKFQSLGIFVFKDAFKDDNFSGFCLYDEVYPIIYINNSMSFSRQIFTLFHELYHLIMATSGIDTIRDEYIHFLEETNQDIERKCNKFAQNFLVENSDFVNECKVIDDIGENIDENIAELANVYVVSKEVILYKLAENRRISIETFQKKLEQYQVEYRRRKSSEKRSGGNYYNTKASYLGKKYLEIVFNKYSEGAIDMFKVAEYLNTNYKVALNMESKFGDGL